MVYTPRFLSHFLRGSCFIFQSRYDRWQVDEVLGRPPEDIVRKFGILMEELLRTTVLQSPYNGAFIDSCMRHCNGCCSPGGLDYWTGLLVENHGGEEDEGIGGGLGGTGSARSLSPAQAFQAWYEYAARPPNPLAGESLAVQASSVGSRNNNASMAPLPSLTPATRSIEVGLNQLESKKLHQLALHAFLHGHSLERPAAGLPLHYSQGGPQGGPHRGLTFIANDSNKISQELNTHRQYQNEINERQRGRTQRALISPELNQQRSRAMVSDRKRFVHFQQGEFPCPGCCRCHVTT